MNNKQNGRSIRGVTLITRLIRQRRPTTIESNPPSTDALIGSLIEPPRKRHSAVEFGVITPNSTSAVHHCLTRSLGRIYTGL